MVYVCFECSSDTKSDPDSYLVQLFLGLYSGKLDGIIGVRTKSAIQRWRKRNSLPSSGEVTEIQLAKLEQEAAAMLPKKESNRKPIAGL